jgi:hypothetical protein
LNVAFEQIVYLPILEISTMLKKLACIAVLTFSSLLSAELFAASLIGQWNVKLNLRSRAWNESGVLVTDEKNIYTGLYYFYPNRSYINASQAVAEHGTWRQSRDQFKLYPDYNGPPSVLNGPNNSIIVTKWKMFGNRKGNVIRGKHVWHYIITVWDYFSGIVVTRNVELDGTFVGKRVNVSRKSFAAGHVLSSPSEPHSIEEAIKNQIFQTMNDAQISIEGR